ncbi:MerR family DNA-binding transcriptional regulator [Vibrio maritimus]
MSISESARHYGVPVPTMRRWDRIGKLRCHCRTSGNHRH